METHKLIQGKSRKCIFLALIALLFYACPLLTNAEESMESGEYVRNRGHVMELKRKESFEIRNGRIIYLEYCAPCHGTTGKGDGSYYASGLKPKPPNFTVPGFTKKTDDDYLFNVIWKGTAAFGKSPYCPPWGGTLKEEERVRNIISFLKTLTLHDNTEKSEVADKK